MVEYKERKARNTGNVTGHEVVGLVGMLIENYSEPERSTSERECRSKRQWTEQRAEWRDTAKQARQMKKERGCAKSEQQVDYKVIGTENRTRHAETM